MLYWCFGWWLLVLWLVLLWWGGWEGVGVVGVMGGVVGLFVLLGLGGGVFVGLCVGLWSGWVVLWCLLCLLGCVGCCWFWWGLGLVVLCVWEGIWVGFEWLGVCVCWWLCLLWCCGVGLGRFKGCVCVVGWGWGWVVGWFVDGWVGLLLGVIV